MPLYEVEHICALSDDQRDRLAHEITRIHAEQLTTSKLFINVRFTDVTDQLTYIAGKRKKSNRIIARLRFGPNRSKEDYDRICLEIGKLWASTVGTSGNEELRAIFIIGGLIAGSECGFIKPKAGEDTLWLKEHLNEFQKLADEGREDFIDLIQDLKARDAFKDLFDDAQEN